MFDLQLEWTVGVGGEGRAKRLTPPPTAPLVQILFFPQPSAAIKIKDGGHKFRYEITEHSLARITLALQATIFFTVTTTYTLCFTKVNNKVRGRPILSSLVWLQTELDST